MSKASPHAQSVIASALQHRHTMCRLCHVALKCLASALRPLGLRGEVQLGCCRGSNQGAIQALGNNLHDVPECVTPLTTTSRLRAAYTQQTASSSAWQTIKSSGATKQPSARQPGAKQPAMKQPVAARKDSAEERYQKAMARMAAQAAKAAAAALQQARPKPAGESKAAQANGVNKR